jgi:hypothetical protein
MQKPATKLQKDGSHQNPKDTKRIARFPRLIRRFPRRNAEDIAFYRRAMLIAEVETEAVEWIGRGREANIQLGRRFIRLKDLVGHGHFERYYERKFGLPYGIRFRTAQAYMQLARKADEEAKNADSALFPLATDSQAVAIREATEKKRLAVADAKQESSGEFTTNADMHPSKESKGSSNSMCTCRLHIRTTKERSVRIAALWKSEHRHSAESKTTDYLIELCDEYDIKGNDADEDHESED